MNRRVGQRSLMSGWIRLPLWATTLAMAVAWGAVAGEDSPAELTPVGNPLAPGMMKLIAEEMQAGLKHRAIEANFSRFQNYLGWKLDSTKGHGGNSEVKGYCRLSWYDHLLRNPMQAPAEAEEFTRLLHQALLGEHEGLDRALALARSKMDCPARGPGEYVSPTSPEEALEAVQRALCGAQQGHRAALAPLTKAEIAELSRSLLPVFVTQVNSGHTLSQRPTGRRVCGILEKLDRNALFAAADALVPLADLVLLEQLRALPEPEDGDDAAVVPGATGRLVRRLVTPSGTIVVGGSGKNVYQLDEMADVNVVIDLGGDDEYHEGTVSLKRPVLIVIDLGGDDLYRATQPGVQGAALLGVSILIDAAGNDVYQARDLAQGSALAGVGILIDREGDDSYVGVKRVQGHALGGLGLLVDRAGNDRYRGAMWTQGFGGPLGFGVLDDLDGEDHYYTGGLYYDSYEETPGYEGWGQGVGAGLRQSANGGIGVILDGGGDDVYEFDYMAHGGGYWLGLGFARDFGGNDRRLGATLKTFNGGTRTERRFQRFGTGFGCHYALGFCFDDEGDDTYDGTIMGLGFAWDCAVGALCDFGGNDQYLATGNSTQGNAGQAGLGILYDYEGDDVYKGYGQGNAPSNISYHTLPQCGGNFAFLVDYGGTDGYGCGAKNNTYNRRGSAGGFLVDRPGRKSETAQTPEPADKQTPSGS